MRRTTVLVLLLPGLIGCSAMVEAPARHEPRGWVVAACYETRDHRGSLIPNPWAPSLVPLSTNIHVVRLEDAKSWSFALPPPGGYPTHSDDNGVFSMSLSPGEYVAYVQVYDTWLPSGPFVIYADRITYVTKTFYRPLELNAQALVSQN